MAKFELNATRDEIIRDINITLEEYESGILPPEVAQIVLYEALVSAYYYIVKNEEE
jgi:hypothetical protein